MMQPNNNVEIFCCYAHEDEALIDELRSHLSSLERQNLINVWHDRDISPGAVWKKEIETHLNDAQIILLLISSAFIQSNYCYGIEMQQAIERYERNEARVIPIILRPVFEWQKIPIGNITLGDLQALPKDIIPITMWTNHDQAWNDVATGIAMVVSELSGNLPQKKPLSLLTRRNVLLALGGIAVASITGIAINNIQTTHQTSNSPPTITPSTVPLPTFISISTFSTLPTASFDEPSGLDIHALAWSPDGRKMAVAYENNLVDIWDTVTENKLYQYQKHQGPVEGVSWSPDGKYLVSSSADGTAQIWSAAGTTKLTYQNHKEIDINSKHPRLNRVQWSPDGNWIASCDQTGDPHATATVQIWNPQTGNTFTTYREHKNGVHAAAWSPDSNYIASIGYDGTLRVWEALSGKTLFTKLIASAHRLYGVSWSRDGQNIVFGGDDCIIWLVDSKGGDPLNIHTLPSKTGLGVRDVTYSPKGNYYAVSTDGQGVFIFHDTSNSPERQYKIQDIIPGDIAALGWSPTEPKLAMGNAAGSTSYSVQVWKTFLD